MAKIQLHFFFSNYRNTYKFEISSKNMCLQKYVQKSMQCFLIYILSPIQLIYAEFILETPDI